AQVAAHGRKEHANLGSIKVPDPRIDRLAELYHPKKRVFAEVTFIDVPGPSAEDARKSLDAELVRQMREVDALVHVARGFASPIDGSGPNPAEDIAAFESEMILTDLIQVETRLERLSKERSASPLEREALAACQDHLAGERPLRTLSLQPQVWNAVAGFRFLSQKPILVLINQSEEGLKQGEGGGAIPSGGEGAPPCLELAGQVEMEISRLAPEDQAAFLQDLGLQEPARDRFIRAAYELLDLISFLTAGEDECRAWPIRRGTVAHKAAGKIHSDIERGFIRAEVVHYEDLIALGSEAKAREAGKLRLEGKEYVVRDGDVIHFRFNV
ncbi:MAG: redox-regulated ATPase YchF, partial [Acidobacteria bacterium]|nr:redox-regulated ATPase YchF [Acidobacteriota bacterium]